MVDIRRSIDKRLRICLLFMLAGLLVLVVALWFFQVVRTDRYVRLASENRLRMLRFPPIRGEIFDRNGVPLALNLKTFNIMGYPLDIKKYDLLPIISDVLTKHGIPSSPEDLSSRIEKQYWAPYRAVIIVQNLTLTQMTAIISDPVFPRLLFPIQVTCRTYPAGSIASHILGYVAEISREELISRGDSGYKGGDFIGKNGIEKQYEDLLRGKSGEEILEVDARGRKIRSLTEKVSEKGKDLHLTVDLGAQRLVETLFGDFRGAAVAIDVETGEVRVLFSAPGYDNNPLAWGVSGAEWAGLIYDESKPMMNRALSGVYPPASTFKPFVGLAALSEKAITKNTTFFCGGAFKFGGRVFKCWQKYGHGNENVVSAIRDSCDIFFYQAGLKTGIDNLVKWGNLFGVGKLTGIDLPGESNGNIAGKDWKMEKFHEKWYQGDTVNYSIGQGYLLVTPIQLVRMYAALANGGKLFLPRLVSVNQPQYTQLDLNGYNLNLVRKGLIDVVKRGTGIQAGEFDVSVAGKTGTAQNPHGPDHALFVGYAPVKEPRYAAAVIIEGGEHGSSVAAPIVGKLLAYLVTHDETYSKKN